MSGFNLNERKFSPVSNSANGRVKNDAVFEYAQNGDVFTAKYSGEGFSDGHIIGKMTGPNTAELVYHCRDNGSGALETGAATAVLGKDANGLITMKMDWQWLNGDQSFGQSFYKEHPHGP